MDNSCSIIKYLSKHEKMKQIDLFNQSISNNKHNWRDEWQDMPEYNNIKPKEPEITATFKFRNKEDFEKFMSVIKEQLFNGKRVFDGKQLKNNYSAWYPLDSRPSEFIYILDENEK